jgi:outer membrane receptor for ferrienterochelin and colicins
MILNKVLKNCVLIMSLSCFSQVKSQQYLDTTKVNQLEEVVITATRTIRQLSSVPLAVTLVSNKDIKKAGSTRLKNILQEQTGIIFVTDASGFEGVQLQGLNAAYTLVLIDGVPLIGRSAGTLDLNRLTVNDIKQIEIVKGPSSSLYGSEAIGGVINIITNKLNRDVSKGNFQYYIKGGRRSELDLNTNYIYKKNKFGIKAGVNLNSGGAFDVSPKTASNTTEPYKSFTGTLDINYDLNDKIKFIQSNRLYKQNQILLANTNTVKEYNFNTKLSHDISNVPVKLLYGSVVLLAVFGDTSKAPPEFKFTPALIPNLFFL